MPSTQPTIERGVFGTSENDLPPSGVHGVAVWPVIESAPGRPGAAVITRMRHHLAWRSMRRHATRITELRLVDPPKRIEQAIQADRAAAGLAPATVA